MCLLRLEAASCDGKRIRNPRLMRFRRLSDMEAVDDLTKEFLAESLEGLDRMDRCLTELEARPDDAELLGEIFRAVHTIKGTTGFLGFARLETLAHAGENLLGALRDGRLKANAPVVSGLLQLMDGLRGILQLIERTGREGARAEDDDSALIALMADLHQPAGPKAAALQAAGPPALSAAVSPGPSTSEKTLRIDVDVLNRMVNLVGELVLTRNQMLQTHLDSSSFPELARRLDCVTADLREAVMQARMQPVGHLFGKFPRLVRDLAQSCGKNVRIEFEGQETGLDKSLLEAIKDPLTHAIRNAVDHGIESAIDRALAGKPVEGLIWLRAWHQGGSVVIEIEDDGAGIAIGRVREKAIERQLVSPESVDAMTEREILQLIFMPGFSTAQAVSHISGRGVGMDVVRNNVEKVGGTIEIESREGLGTRLRLRVPLTLAIVPALVVCSGGQSFCLPQSSLAELVCVSNAEAEAAIERIGDAELFRLREHSLPMVWLDSLLGLAERRAALCAHGFYLAVLEADGCRFGLVVDELLAPEEIVVKPVSSVLRDIGLFSGATVLGNGALALILDVAAIAARAGVRPVAERVLEREAKSRLEEPKGPSFLVFEDAALGGYTDGDDVFGSQSGSQFGSQPASLNQPCGTAEPPRRKALPLDAVERIESIALRDVECAAGRPLLQFRGTLLPLEVDLDLTRTLLLRNPEATATVLICRKSNGHRVGLVVGRVLDVAAGTVLAQDVQIGDEKLALINDRVITLCTSFADTAAPDERWKEVA